jgi:3-isopropylmalate dehydrogenase
MNNYKIAVLAGDGIGKEVIPCCVELLRKVSDKVKGFSLEFDSYPAGAECYLEHGIALPDETLKRAEQADAILLGAMGLPDIRYPDGTEIIPQIDLRIALDLYAGVRPVRPYPQLSLPLRNAENLPIDFVLIRESTEGMFASLGKGKVIDDAEAVDFMKITRNTSERLFDFAFELAAERKQSGHEGLVTCVDKANVFTSLAFFRKIFYERAEGFHDSKCNHMYVDAAAMNMVTRPWNFDVMVMENMFGDILSDLGAALMGGMGMAPSADIGDNNAVFQPCHGTAPDIAGKGVANPTAMHLSGAMMLKWLGKQHDDPACKAAGELLTQAVDYSFQTGQLVPVELGGTANTEAINNAVFETLDSLAVDSRI